MSGKQQTDLVNNPIRIKKWQQNQAYISSLATWHQARLITGGLPSICATSEKQAHYEDIKRMVKEKTGRAMQEKERERKGKNGKIIKVAGCSPIREGVLLIRPDTTLADVHKFGEECQKRWGITPLQIFLHKDEGHWLNGQPAPEDRESFKVGGRWFKPNYHAHIVFDWMNHDTGRSRKLNDDDMMQMQTLASDILLMERGKSKAVTGKEHLESRTATHRSHKAA